MFLLILLFQTISYPFRLFRPGHHCSSQTQLTLLCQCPTSTTTFASHTTSCLTSYRSFKMATIWSNKSVTHSVRSSLDNFGVADQNYALQEVFGVYRAFETSTRVCNVIGVCVKRATIWPNDDNTVDDLCRKCGAESFKVSDPRSLGFLKYFLVWNNFFTTKKITWKSLDQI